MVYDRVHDKNNFSYKKFGLWKPFFHATVTTEIEAEVIFCHNVIHEYCIITAKTFQNPK